MASIAAASSAAPIDHASEVAAAGDDLATAQAAMTAQIVVLEGKLAQLTAKYSGRRGRREKPDSQRTAQWKEDIQDLRNGEWPAAAKARRREERRIEAQAAAALAKNGAAANAAHHAAPTDARGPGFRVAAPVLTSAGGGSGGGGSGGAGAGAGAANEEPPDDSENDALHHTTICEVIQCLCRAVQCKNSTKKTDSFFSILGMLEIAFCTLQARGEVRSAGS